MQRRIPPFEQIEAFIEAARAPSFRVAAERCALSPAAFSRRVQAFSGFVGLTLFERVAGGARLTDAGRACLAELEPAYLELRRVAAAIAHVEAANVTVKLSLSHSLAVGWLIPRLGRFHETHPGIELSFKTQRGAADIRRGDVDLGLCFSDIDLSGLVVEPLLHVACTPVASPDLAQSFQSAGGTLADYRLLALATPPGMWSWWARATGYVTDTLEPDANFDMLQAVYETAARGQGIALGASPTVWPYLESGRLVRLDLPVAPFEGCYRLAAAPDRRRQRPVAAVWRWIESEARRTPSLT